MFSLIFVFIYAISGASYADTEYEKSGPEVAISLFKKELSSLGEWPERPTVVVCKNTPVSTEAVESAVAWWRSLGYDFWMIIPDSIHYGCVFGKPNGKILIRLVNGQTFNADNLATTYIYHNEETKEILWAEIFLREEPKERVLEHEIGHALGWLHYSKKNHIMHPIWTHSGWDDNGLRKY